MKLSNKNINILNQLIAGEILAASKANTKLIEELIQENILFVSGKHKRKIQLKNKEALFMYFSNQNQIDLEEYLNTMDNAQTRADFVKLTTDSKDSKERAFKGFLVNSFSKIPAILHNKRITIKPPEGSFIFIYDFEDFRIDEQITVVGVENSLNFRYIQKQAYLFEDKNILFASRYPQNQSKDFIKWLASIPNKYIHFGDFDLAGIGIYLNEYKKHLGAKARFFIPGTIENDLKEKGNRKRYDLQKQNFEIDDIDEPELLNLVNLIHKSKRGLDQEFYIKH